jgi:hypothetical protein
MIARRTARFLARRLANYGWSGKTPPHVALSEYHVRDCRVLPNRNALLENLPKGGVAAEIGVATGDFAADVLRTNKPALLHLIDAWDRPRYRAVRTFVESRFSEQIGAANVRVHVGLSTQVLESFEDGYFDWVYVDTDHSYETTLSELTICNRKLKPDGRLAGHDFSKGNPVRCLPYGVIDACHEFCVRDNWAYEYLTLDNDGDFSFCLKRL